MTGKTSTGPTEIRLGRYNGTTFDLLTEVGTISRRELCDVLAGERRCAGHTRWPYTVADHSLFCWRGAVKLGASLEAQRAVLLHDLTEACGIHDMPRPIKKVLSGYRELELAIRRQLEARWEYSLDQHAQLVHDLDMWAWYVEAKHLQGRNMGDAPKFMHELFSCVEHDGQNMLDAWNQVGYPGQPQQARADHVHAAPPREKWLYEQFLDILECKP